MARKASGKEAIEYYVGTAQMLALYKIAAYVDYFCTALAGESGYGLRLIGISAIRL
jgi:hypothetical protein